MSLDANQRDGIGPAEAERAFERLSRFRHVVLAVSGGPDSMALLVLAAEWRARRGGDAPAISVATVDHGLRAGSAEEAEFVGAQASRLGLAHTVLRWEGEKPRTGIAEAAREARYRLLERHASGLGAGPVAVVTAHHLDDQAETFAMRLARGAGVDGLAAMRAERPLGDGSPVTLVRPLLAFAKARLVATLGARGVGSAEDPTNQDERFERVRIRRHLPGLAAAGLTADSLATSARRLGEAEAALRYGEEKFVATLGLSFGNEVFAALDREAFDAGPAYLRQRVLAWLIGRYGGASAGPQLCEIEDLAERMARDVSCTATLGGALISGGRRRIRVWREAGRLRQGDIVLSAGERVVFDRRFVVAWAGAGGAAVTVRALGPEAYLKIADRLVPRRRPPARATYALPSFWSGGDLIAVPSLAPFAAEGAPALDRSGCGAVALAAPSRH